MLPLDDEITPLTSADLARVLQMAGQVWTSVAVYIVDGTRILRQDSLDPSDTQHALTSDAAVRQTSEALDETVRQWKRDARSIALIIDPSAGTIRVGLTTDEITAATRGLRH